ncbi:DUF742 domain-containing protein [Nocardia farcinica]|uniref:DUF742 domain-containing protein n=1 Tax=Nocardia farcinica TaxID=37329 RepID=UPI000A37092A|nr:DUF742 domain-containing protein [Nocardia farcinica]MBA4857532.1 DUF742 domain-containing protein [Nocardia farcinica]MBC9816169.1 DUF742 domain-containing protein [Nocardia farcinica]MBF6072400.1 DUF742 domain-containing protein [Nocardia farcinica]MBF6262428.1 DUF742 domain-containing protein [Nocardia farcinica]MBF6280968.1 DUF742 domain-containing protein [Nocardia farcinica]
MNDGDWARFEDDDPGPLVRPFVVTRGRVGTELRDLDLLTLVYALRPDEDNAALDREYAAIVRLCQAAPLSIAEISAHLGLLVVAVKVLVSDLANSGYVVFRSPPAGADSLDPHLLQAVLDGIRRL